MSRGTQCQTGGAHKEMLHLLDKVTMTGFSGVVVSEDKTGGLGR
jgi:hypothetical protein